jgi:hypothetical protein
MPTKNPRINITLLVKELVLEALGRREDKMLSAIAELHDTIKEKRVNHNDAWE